MTDEGQMRAERIMKEYPAISHRRLCMSLLALAAFILLSLVDTCECAQSVLPLSGTPTPRAVGLRSFISPPRLRDFPVSSSSGRELWFDNPHHAYAHRHLFFHLTPAHLRQANTRAH